jgi:queuine tRNA-ribosyltransferase
MGVGYPLDLMVCVALGADMFDCVYPTRVARFGVAIVPSGTMRLKAKEFSMDLGPVEEGCLCSTCKHYTRAFLHTAFKDNNAIAAQLLTKHNIAHMMTLMRTMREAILNGPETYEAFVRNFLRVMFPLGNVPVWTVEALAAAGMTVETSCTRESEAKEQKKEPVDGEVDVTKMISSDCERISKKKRESYS